MREPAPSNERTIQDRVVLVGSIVCNNRCRFCALGAKSEAPVDLSEQLQALESGRRRGCTSLLLAGGEPTLRDDLASVVREARRLGYADIGIETNARRLCYPRFSETVIEAGIDRFTVGVHGSTPKIHDAITRAEGSHEQTIDGIRNLRRLGASVTTRTMIGEANYRDLPDLARLLCSLDVEPIELRVGPERADWPLLPMRDVLPYVQRALDLAGRAGIEALVEGIPACAMGGYRASLAPARTDARREKVPSCASCREETRCPGPYGDYIARFGAGDVEPIASSAAQRDGLVAVAGHERDLWANERVLVLPGLLSAPMLSRIDARLDALAAELSAEDEAQGRADESYGERLRDACVRNRVFWDEHSTHTGPPTPARIGLRLEQIDELREAIFSPAILRALHDRIDDPAVATCCVIDKPAGGRFDFPLHQDNWYADVKPDVVVGVWIALDDVDEDNGCVHIMPGSYRLGRLADHWAEHDNGSDVPRVAGFALTPVVLAAGSAAVFDGMNLHRSERNVSQRRRRALVTHFVSASAVAKQSTWFRAPPAGFVRAPRPPR